MATYHLHVRIISRSKGRSSVAAAAYRSRSTLRDERQGLTFDYRENKDCAYSEIMAPDNAEKWMYDREKLWNHIELIENRKNSQLSRDIEIALPKELTLEQNIDLIRDYIEQNFVSMGMIADLNIHNKDNNPHAHIMLTMRRIEGKGFGTKKDARSWNAKHLTLKWRKEWADLHNHHMAKHGYDVRIDHRSYKEQGINIIPQIKLGITSHYKDPEFDRVAEYKRIAFENGKEIINNPKIALDHLSRMQSTFTHDDILRYVHEHSDRSQFYDAVSAIEKSPELVLIQENDYSKYNRYTSRSLVLIENQMIKDASKLSNRKTHHIPKQIIDQAIVSRGLSVEQAVALRQAINGNDLHVIIGDAGSGKTYTMGAVKEVFEASGYKLRGVALSNVAARGLERDTGIRSTNIAKLITNWDVHNKDQLDANTVLVIDEAGMVGTRQMQRMLAEAQRVGAQVIPIGDLKQTQAVEAGGAFRALLEHAGASRLRQVWRQKIDWQIEATYFFSGDEKHFGKGIDLYVEHGLVHEFGTLNIAADSMLSDYVQSFTPDTSAFMTAYKNEDVDRLNRLCRHKLKQDTFYIDRREYEVSTSSGVKLFAAGDRIQFLKKDREMGVDNGTFGTVKEVSKDGCMVVELGDKHRIAFDTKYYNAITYGYAATVHKLQGATVDKCYVLASQGFDRHLSYVAMTRHRHDMNLYWSHDNFENLEHLKRSFSSLADKELIKDYGGTPQDIIDKHLNKLTRHDATFDEKQLKDVLSKLDEMEQEELKERIVMVGDGVDGSWHYTTEEMIETEKRLFENAAVMGERKTHCLDKALVDDAISRTKTNKSIRFALSKTLGGSDLTIIESRHQEDKIYIANILAEAYKKQDYMVDAVTLSGAGAENFTKATGIQSATTFKRLWELDSGKNVLSDRSVLVVDNANMIDTKILDRLIVNAEKSGAKMILLGDMQTAQSVGAGGAYRGIIERCRGNIALIDRNKKTFDWEDKAKALLRQDWDSAGKGVDILAFNGVVQRVDDKATAVVDDWFNGVEKEKSYISNVMITHRNKDVAMLNSMARSRLAEAGYLDLTKQTAIVNQSNDELNFAAGDRILFLRKDADMGIQAGTFGTIRHIENDVLDVRLVDATRVKVNTRLYNDLTHGYAVNIYKSANMKVDNTYIMTSKGFDKQSFSAALEAHTKSSRVYHEDTYKEFRRLVSRPRDKELVADYPMERQAYKITVTPFTGAKGHTKFIEVKPQVNKKHLKQQVTRKAQAFAAQVANKARLRSDQAKDMVIKVERMPMDQYQQKQLSKDKAVKKDKGQGIEF